MKKTQTYYTILFLLYFSLNAMGNTDKSMGNTDSINYETVSDFEKLIEAGDSSIAHKTYEKALSIFLKSLRIAEQEGIDSLYEISHFKLVSTHFNLKKYVDVIYHANEFEYYAIEEISKRQAEVKKIISDVYRETGQGKKAKNYMKKSLSIWEKLSNLDEEKKEVNYQYCSTIFYNNVYEEALLCYDNFLEKVKLEKDTYNIIRSTIAMGACYGRIEDYENSIPALLDASKMLEHKSDIRSLRLKGYVHHNLGNDYFGAKKLDKALDEVKKAITCREKEGSRVIGFTYSLASKILEVMGDEEKMNVYLEQAIKSAQNSNDDRLYRQIYIIKKDNALRKKDYATANKQLEKIIALDDKKYKEDVEGAMAREMAKGAVNKKELEIKSLRLEKEHEQQQRLSLAFILALISLLFIGSLYFIHRSRKANQELEAKNKLIEKQKEELETSNKNLANKNKLIEKQKEELEISNKDLEQFAYIASHDLKEPVRTIGSYASLLNRRYSDKLGDSGSEFVSFIKQASIRMNLLLTDLLHYSRLNKHKFEKTDVNMNNILIIVEENLYGVFKDNKVKLEVTDLPLVQANKIQMVRMFQNLIKNGVVYNKSEGKTIKIWAEEEKEKWTFFVKDNGIGIAPEYQEKVFEIFKRLHSKDEYDGSGIGLSSCQKIVMMHGGKINLKSELGEGTTFYFTIPKE